MGWERPRLYCTGECEGGECEKEASRREGREEQGINGVGGGNFEIERVNGEPQERGKN